MYTAGGIANRRRTVFGLYTHLQTPVRLYGALIGYIFFDKILTEFFQ